MDEYPRVNKKIVRKRLEGDLMLRNWKFKDDRFFIKTHYEDWLMRDKINDLKKEYEDDVIELKYEAKKKISDALEKIDAVYNEQIKYFKHYIMNAEDKMESASPEEIEELELEISYLRNDMKDEGIDKNDALKYLRRK